MNLFRELCKVGRLKPNLDEPVEKFSRRLVRAIDKLCDKDPEVWNSMSDLAQVWVNTASQALHEKLPVPELEDYRNHPKEKTLKPPKIVDPNAPPHKKRGPQARVPGGLLGFRDRWNALVPEAIRLGVPGVAIHGANFESYGMAEKRLAWLDAQIAERKSAHDRWADNGGPLPPEDLTEADTVQETED